LIILLDLLWIKYTHAVHQNDYSKKSLVFIKKKIEDSSGKLL